MEEGDELVYYDVLWNCFDDFLEEEELVCFCFKGFFDSFLVYFVFVFVVFFKDFLKFFFIFVFFGFFCYEVEEWCEDEVGNGG